jgi:lipopolysaccharide transport system ATP-binding protein
MDVVIKTEQVSKKFILLQEKRESYTALRDVISSKWSQWWNGKNASIKRNEQFYALRDINIEIKRGERVGIIGRNGAGKSTLLKILSRITAPSEGQISIRGRVASLLEVGTGFHPELTGRENIFLNGAILGMSRAEISKKFDEIVAFAEVEKFLDTPVKRYSSGMYVRLAFAVAAHLEPEILIVDEVLAVGDIQFQKKCLGKMEEVSKNEGRTVIFVSHNMAAISALTNVGIFLKEGSIAFSGEVSEAIRLYSDAGLSAFKERKFRELNKGKHTQWISFKLFNEGGEEVYTYKPSDPFLIEATLYTDGSDGMSFEFFLVEVGLQTRLGLLSLYHFEKQTLPTRKGTYVYRIRMNSLPLASGSYRIDAYSSFVNVGWDHKVESAIEFEILYSSPTGSPWDFKASFGYGHMALLCNEIELNQSNAFH